jgi:hypothetical protein
VGSLREEKIFVFVLSSGEEWFGVQVKPASQHHGPVCMARLSSRATGPFSGEMARGDMKKTI